ncbi:MAG: hypothetical protein AB1758_34560, partial [Candidatus Eremiobacterota bacterium]
MFDFATQPVTGRPTLSWVPPIPALSSPFDGLIGRPDQVSLNGEISDAEFFQRLSDLQAMRWGFRPQAQPQAFNPWAPTPQMADNANFFSQIAALKQAALAQA